MCSPGQDYWHHTAYSKSPISSGLCCTVQPANSLVLPPIPTAAHKSGSSPARTICKEEIRRYVAHVFRTGVGQNMRRMLPLCRVLSCPRARGLQPHKRHALEYIVHLKTEHCALDVTSIEDTNAHYYRGRPIDERLSKLAAWLDQEQIRLVVNSIISNSKSR